MTTASTATALPTFDVYTLAHATTAHCCAYACPGGEEIRAEVTVDDDAQIRFHVTARPADILPERAQQLLRACLRGPEPIGFSMRPGVYARLRQQLSTGDVWMPR